MERLFYHVASVQRPGEDTASTHPFLSTRAPAAKLHQTRGLLRTTSNNRPSPQPLTRFLAAGGDTARRLSHQGTPVHSAHCLLSYTTHPQPTPNPRPQSSRAERTGTATIPDPESCKLHDGIPEVITHKQPTADPTRHCTALHPPTAHQQACERRVTVPTINPRSLSFAASRTTPDRLDLFRAVWHRQGCLNSLHHVEQPEL